MLFVCTRERRVYACCHEQAADEPTIPPDILPLVEDEDESELYAGVDKAATPAERPSSAAALARDLDRARPLIL